MLIAFLTAWWNELTLAKQIFYGIGLIAGLVSLILVVLAVIGADHHDAADALGADLDDPSNSVFSLKPVTGFFLGFGWLGGMALDQGVSIPFSTAIGLAGGSAIMGLIMLMIRGIMAMRSDGTMQIKSTVGAVGTVYVSLPPSRAQGGQVIVNFDGRQETFSALNTSEHAIPSGDKVRVLEVLDSRTLLVEPLA